MCPLRAEIGPIPDCYKCETSVDRAYAGTRFPTCITGWL